MEKINFPEIGDAFILNNEEGKLIYIANSLIHVKVFDEYRIHHLINFINGKIVWNSHGYWIVLG